VPVRAAASSILASATTSATSSAASSAIAPATLRLRRRLDGCLASWKYPTVTSEVDRWGLHRSRL
jgi:hypothetical protein